MISEAAVWTIFFLPLCAFLIIAFLIRPFFNRYAIFSSALLIVFLIASLGLSIWALASTILYGNLTTFHEWVTVGELEVRIGIMLNPLTAVMLVVVTGVSLMVQVYSQGYMRDDPGYARYFAFMSLFTASMVGLVIASNIVQLYIFWELVGLCSYLLIGFWYHRPVAAAAAKKAFIVTRIGDFGFLLAILYLFFQSADFMAQGLNPLEIPDIYQGVAIGVLGGTALTWLAVGIFAGAVGKSAQFPLHTWLPDAMEGPTPVSALIHAATMVAAGVFLVARFFPLFEASSEAMSAVAIVGAFTALFAATMGLVMNDIKRVMAYSTISQLGFMMAALGVGAYGAAIFHLFNHAFFKSLLFLGAGSVNHATGTFDMRYMGGLRRYMPVTYITTLIAALSLVGIFPLSGFWSKDEILLGAWRGGSAVSTVTFWLLIVAVFLTAFYAFRMIYLTFHGSFRGGAPAEMSAVAVQTELDAGTSNPGSISQQPVDTGNHGLHLAESPVLMVLPMIILGVASVVSGYFVSPVGLAGGFLGVTPHWLREFLAPLAGEHHAEGISIPLASISVLVALGGIGVATAMYMLRWSPLEKMAKSLRGLHTLLSQRYYMDHLYEGQLVKRTFYRGGARILYWFDRAIVDDLVDRVGWFWGNIGLGIRRLQTGQVQGYGIAIPLGIVLILLAYLIWG